MLGSVQYQLMKLRREAATNEAYRSAAAAMTRAMARSTARRTAAAYARILTIYDAGYVLLHIRRYTKDHNIRTTIIINNCVN